MDQLKEAFSKVKQDITYLKGDIFYIKQELTQLNKTLLNLFKSGCFEQKSGEIPSSTQNAQNPTLRHINTTNFDTSTDTSTHKPILQSLKAQNIEISTGNEGVSTDRQTIRQTDKSREIPQITQPLSPPDPSIVLDQLDTIKQEIKDKIKSLTTQEMLVFSSIYQFEDQDRIIDYTLLSTTLSLSESSIRDYVQRIINKGVPITKEKVKNKRIILHISEDLRRLASLNTLIQLREL